MISAETRRRCWEFSYLSTWEQPGTRKASGNYLSGRKFLVAVSKIGSIKPMNRNFGKFLGKGSICDPEIPALAARGVIPGSAIPYQTQCNQSNLRGALSGMCVVTVTVTQHDARRIIDSRHAPHRNKLRLQDEKNGPISLLFHTSQAGVQTVSSVPCMYCM